MVIEKNIRLINILVYKGRVLVIQSSIKRQVKFYRKSSNNKGFDREVSKVWPMIVAFMNRTRVLTNNFSFDGTH